MITKTLPGYWYCDARPNGSYCASVFNSEVNIINGTGIVGKELLYTVLDQNGQKFAGSDHNGNHAWEFNGSALTDAGVNEGNHACYYDKDNILQVVKTTQGNPPSGALGYRYIDDDGVSITTADTYNPESPLGIKYGITNLYEYTIRKNGNIIIGQGAQSGVEAIIDGVHRIGLSKLINDEVQNVQYVNYHQEGNAISISWYFFRSPTDYTACFVWLTEEELRAMIQEEPIVSTPMMKAFERPMWQSPFFSHSSKYGQDSAEEFANRGNAIWIEYPEAESVLSLGHPIIVAPDPSITFDKSSILNQTIAWWISSGNINDLIARVQQTISNYPEKPIIAYLDGDGWPTGNPFLNLPPRIWPSIQAYRFPNEVLQSFANRVNAVVLRVLSYDLPMFLTTRFDDFNGSSSIDNIVECMSYYETWIEKYPFIGHMPFSDRRGNAISSNQILQDWARAFLYAMPFGRPNRFDYWIPEGQEIKTTLENKFGQSRASVVLEPYLRDDILSKYDESAQEWPDLSSTLEQVRSEHPSQIDVNECVTVLNKVAWIHRAEGWGLLKKEGGNHGVQNVTGTFCSVDWLVNKDLEKGTDCLINTPSSVDGPSLAPANPTWPNDGEFFDGDGWVAPVEP